MENMLKLGFWLHKINDEKCWIKFRYERLQHFCYGCGILGHEQCEYNRPRVWGSDTSKYKRYFAKLGIAPTRSLDTLSMDLNFGSLFQRMENPTLNLQPSPQTYALNETTICEVSKRLEQCAIVSRPKRTNLTEQHNTSTTS